MPASPASSAPRPSPLKAVCVYCGSMAGGDPRYIAAARTFGTALAAAGVGLVYGGGGRGLMGETARAVLEAGGHVTGIIPDFLTDHDAVLTNAQALKVVPDMHTRKQMMFDLADAFVALPGGVGTLEELVEQLTWVQLQRHVKPVLVADIGGFWQPLLALLDHMRGQGFIPKTLGVRPLVVAQAEDILPALMEAAAHAAAAGAATPTLDVRL